MVHNDHLATPQKMTGSTGAVVWAADYKSFGESTITVSTITNNLRFPGQYFDQETGLNYNYYRDYNPALGRYIETDPLNMGSVRTSRTKKAIKIAYSYLKNPQNQNLFAYVLNNPAKLIDMYGLSAADVDTIINTFNNTVTSMTNAGERNSNEYWNNFSRSMYDWFGIGRRYLVCHEQTDRVTDNLRRNQYDDNWHYENMHRPFPPHWWGVAWSDNPNDPVVSYDPWHNTIETR